MGRHIIYEGKNGEGIDKYKVASTEQSRGRKCSTGNTVNDIVTTVRGVRGVLDLLGGPLCELRANGGGMCFIQVF